MFGYISPNTRELKLREYDTYKAYYCGLCKMIGKRYNVLLKNALSNDCTFLALLLSSLSEQKDQADSKRCMAHPTKKQLILRENEYLEYAADINVLLTYYKLKDNADDEASLTAKVGAAGIKSSAEKAKKYRPQAANCIEESLKKLKKLENEKCSDIDLVSDVFATMMEGIAASAPNIEPYEKQLKWLFYNIGKYIYILDAIDDLVKDEEKNCYNVFLNKYKDEKAEKIAVEIMEQVKYNLAMSLSEASKAYELLPIQKNEGILKNIIYDGTVSVMDAVIKRRCIDGSI